MQVLPYAKFGAKSIEQREVDENYQEKALQLFQMMKDSGSSFDVVANAILTTYHRWYEETLDDWIMSMFFPEQRITARIPNIVPIPTHIYTERKTIMLTPAATNTSGTYWIQFVPQARSNADTYKPIVVQILTAGVDVMGYTWNFDPATYFKSYRCTAAAIIVTYMGSIEKAKGRAYGAIEFDTDNLTNAVETEDQMQNKYYSDSNHVLQGQKVIWIPKDYSDMDFRPTTDTTGGTNLQILITGTPVDEGTICKVDIYRTIEGVPKPDYYQLLTPQTALTTKQPQEVFQRVQEATSLVGPIQLPSANREEAKQKWWQVIGSKLSGAFKSAGQMLKETLGTVIKEKGGDIIQSLATSMMTGGV